MVYFSIAGIIQSIDKQLYCYDTTYRTYQEAMIHTDAEFDMVVVLSTPLATGSNRYMFINMIDLLTDYLTGVGEKLIYNVSTWTELETFLSDLYNLDITVFNKYLKYSPAPRYQYYRDTYGNVHTRNTPFQSNMTEGIDIVSLGYTSEIIGSYVDKDAPKIRNLSHRRVSMPDLVFSKVNEDVTFNFKNTLVSVDGVICYPIYSESTDELYACNGARFLRNTTDAVSMNIILMDFTNLGTLHHYKLSECKQELVIKAGNNVYLYDNPNKIVDSVLDSSIEYWHQAQYSMRFTLPEGAINGHPMLSLAGRLFFKGLDDLTIYTTEEGRIAVEFHIANDILENIIASNLQHQNLFYSKSAMFRTILSYVFCNIFVDQAYEYDEGTSEWLAIQFHLDQIIPFITMIETDKEYGIDRVSGTTTMQYGKIIFPPYSKGLLVNKATREFIDYTRIPYKNQTLVTFSPQNSLFIAKREGANTNNELRFSSALTYAEATEFAPETSKIIYNTREHRYKLYDSVKSIYAQSETVPYEKNEQQVDKPYTWDEVVTYLELSESEITPILDTITTTWCIFLNDLPVFETLIDLSTSQDYKLLTWYKVKEYNANDIVWYQVSDGRNIITDGVRTDRMAWQLEPALFIDQYNKYEIGEYIKNLKQYELIDICIEGSTGDTTLLPNEENPAVQPDPEDDLTNQMNPVYTVEYERVRDNINIGEGTAPAPITQFKVEPVIEGETISTTFIVAKNATNIGASYTKYDGKYKLTVDGAVGTERIWANQKYDKIVIKYIPTNELNNVIAHWAVVNDLTEVFATDLADTGTAPYTSTLIWRLANA